MKKQRERKGATLIWMAMLLIALIGVLGLSIDVGYVYVASHQMQNAADAAALAGARIVRSDPEHARLDAQYVAQHNAVAGTSVTLDLNADNHPTGDIVVGWYDRDSAAFTPDTDQPNAVRITARRTDSANGRVGLFFGSVFGAPGANVVRTSTAMSGGGTGAGLIALADSGCGLQMSGNTSLNVDGGSIQVNSQSNCAVCTNGNPTITAPDIDVVGDLCSQGNLNFDGNLNPGSDAIPDPLEGLPAPPIGPPMSTTKVTASSGQVVNLMPGYYPHGIQVMGGATLNLAPGVYAIGKPASGQGSGGQYPAGFNVQGGGTVNGDGVMLYLDDGALDIAANSNVNLTPPDPSAHDFPGVVTYEHVTIFQSHTNTYNARIAGGPGLNISGALYFPNNELVMVGTGAGQFGNQVIASQLSLSGTGEIVVNYNGIFAGAGTSIFLVE